MQARESICLCIKVKKENEKESLEMSVCLKMSNVFLFVKRKSESLAKALP